MFMLEKIELKNNKINFWDLLSQPINFFYLLIFINVCLKKLNYKSMLFELSLK